MCDAIWSISKSAACNLHSVPAGLVLLLVLLLRRQVPQKSDSAWENHLYYININTSGDQRGERSVFRFQWRPCHLTF